MGLTSSLARMRGIMSAAFNTVANGIRRCTGGDVRALKVSRLSFGACTSRFRTVNSTVNVNADRVTGTGSFLRGAASNCINTSSDLTSMSLGLAGLTNSVTSFCGGSRTRMTRSLHSVFAKVIMPLERCNLSLARTALGR